MLLLLFGQLCTEDAVDCACASVAHQVSIECLCNIGYLVLKYSIENSCATDAQAQVGSGEALVILSGKEAMVLNKTKGTG